MTTTTTEPHQLARERRAVFAVFIAFGLVLGTWAAHLPSVKDSINASTSSMGAILLILGVGALIGMQASGYAADKFGSGGVAATGAAAMAVALVPPLLLTSWVWVATAALVLGVAIGIGEVGMNAAAVEVERDYGRPIMASFHGMFSVGTIIGALLGAAAFALDVGVLITAVVVAVLALALAACFTPTLLRRNSTTGPSAADTADDTADDAASTGAPRHRGRLILLGALAFLLLLTEGSAMDWSSLHAQEHLDSASSAGALALACFVAAMTIGRFTIDRVSARIGPVRVLRYGSALSIAGLTLVFLSSALPLTCLGWMLLGLGLSGCVPQVFTATGNLPGASATALSRVVGAGYLAVLAGPAVVGWLADLFGLNNAFILPICAMIICLFGANVLGSPDEQSNDAKSHTR